MKDSLPEIIVCLCAIIFVGFFIILVLEFHEFRKEYRATQTSETLIYASNKMICYRREK